jgi:hypothetical protein
MFEYNVKIKKVSGRLNESVLPQKNLVVKSKSELSMRNILKEAAKYLLENYGLELGDAEVSSKPKRKAPLQREQFSINDLLSLCDKNKNGDYNYSDMRKTPDGRIYKLAISSAATSGRRVWVWAYSSYNPNAKSCAMYDMKEKQWVVKKRNNFINLVD